LRGSLPLFENFFQAVLDYSFGMSVQPITLLLQEFAAGDRSALDSLMPLVYAELRKLAGNQLRRERSSHTLQPNALVHEAYVRLVGDSQPDYRNRAHFLHIAARVMRRILIDHARIHNADKRGGGQLTYALDDWMDPPVERSPAVVAVDDSLQTLERTDPGKAKLIEMRFFGGMTAEESAEVLGLPVEKVRAELRIAQAWLRRDLDCRK
jgi:RNA polymerase sigma factor (TIGR02999 family)